jgi:hypothetical protein
MRLPKASAKRSKNTLTSLFEEKKLVSDGYTAATVRSQPRSTPFLPQKKKKNRCGFFLKKKNRNVFSLYMFDEISMKEFFWLYFEIFE